MASVAVHLPFYSGDAGLVLKLYNGSSLVNTGGDALTESGASGYFEATVDEALSGVLSRRVEDAAGNLIYQDWLDTDVSLVHGMLTAGGAALSDIRDEVDEALIDHFETQTRAKGAVSYLQTLELVAAALVGKSSAPNEDTELFKYLDDSNAFTVTFSTSNYRTVVAVH